LLSLVGVDVCRLLRGCRAFQVRHAYLPQLVAVCRD
jgi:hypothetical protein